MRNRTPKRTKARYRCPVQIKTWAELTKDEFYEISKLRCQVFYVEQRVTDQDFDGVDRAPGTHHLWFEDELGVTAYLRAYELAVPEHGATFSFGRVAVREDRRGERLSSLLVDEVLRRWGDHRMVIHAQEYITKLYSAHGFTPVGETYDEAGIPHRMMVRDSR